MIGFSLAEAGMRLRPVREEDRALLGQWIESDPEHRGTTTVEFFAEQQRGQECYLLLDAEGPVFFLKLTRENGAAIRLDIQFPPHSCKMRNRVRRGLLLGFGWLEVQLSEIGFREVRFSSKNDRLMRAMEKRLNFVHTGHGEMMRALRQKEA